MWAPVKKGEEALGWQRPIFAHKVNSAPRCSFLLCKSDPTPKGEDYNATETVQRLLLQGENYLHYLNYLHFSEANLLLLHGFELWGNPYCKELGGSYPDTENFVTWVTAVQVVQLLWISLWSIWHHGPSCELPSAARPGAAGGCMRLSWLSSHQVRREQTPLQPPHTTVLSTSAALKSLAHVAPVLPDRNSRKNTNCHEYVTITCCPPIRDSELKSNCFKAILALWYPTSRTEKCA